MRGGGAPAFRQEARRRPAGVRWAAQAPCQNFQTGPKLRQEGASLERKVDSTLLSWFYVEEWGRGAICQNAEKYFSLPPACCATLGKSLNISEPFSLQEGST